MENGEEIAKCIQCGGPVYMDGLVFRLSCPHPLAHGVDGDGNPETHIDWSEVQQPDAL